MSKSPLSAPAFAATVATLAAIAQPNTAQGLAGGPELCWQQYPLNVSCGAVHAAGDSVLASQMRIEIQRRLAQCTAVEDWQTEAENTPLVDMLNTWQVRAKIANCVPGIINAANAELETHPRTAKCAITQTLDPKRVGHIIIEPKCGYEAVAHKRLGVRGK